MKKLTDYSKEELIHMMNTIHDTSLQISENKFLWIVYDVEKQKELFELLK
jgi:hypothetical protein